MVFPAASFEHGNLPCGKEAPWNWNSCPATRLAAASEILPPEESDSIRVFESAKHAVVTSLDVVTAKLELVLTFGPTDVLVELIQVLRTAERVWRRLG